MARQPLRQLTAIASLFIALTLAVSPAGAAPPDKGGAIVLKNILCKISVGQTLPSGTDEAFTSDCSLVLTPSATSVSILTAKANIDGWPGGSYSDSGFPCIINRKPVGGGFVCTTDSRTTINPRGKASLNCKCKISDASCIPVVAGKEPCAP